MSESAAEALRSWFASAVGDPDLTLGELVVPEGVGHSNETVLVDLHWTDRDGSSHHDDVVVRFQTTGPGVFPSYDLDAQVACLRQVAAHSAAPVPRVRFFEPDAAPLGRPFYVMDRVQGIVPTDRMPYTLDGWLHDASPAEQEALWWSSLEAMAELHRLDWRAAGLELLDRPEHGPVGLAQQLGWWRDYARWAADGRPNPPVDAGEAWLVEHLPTDPPPVGLTWGDARLSNMLYRDFEVAAVLDWEMASLGPAEVDLAWMLFFRDFFSDGLGVPDLPGFPSHDASITRYEELLGRPVADLRWYTVFACWRHSAIMGRLADLFEANGEIPSGTDARVNNLASRMLASMLDLPAPGEPGGPLG